MNNTIEVSQGFVIRNQGFISTYSVHGKEVQAIRIYDETGVLFETNSGWFERPEYPNRIPAFILPVEPVRKLKEDFKFKGVFYLKYKSKWRHEENHVYLYINASLVGFKPLGERILFDMDTHKSYSNFAEITINAETQEYQKCEPSAANNWEGFEYTTQEFKPITIEIHQRCHRSENTALGNKIEELETKFKQYGITCNDADKILEHFNISEK